MRKALTLAITLLAFLAAPSFVFARETATGGNTTATVKSVSEAKAKKTVGTKKEKKVASVNKRKAVKAQRAVVRQASIQQLMGPPYTGGELNLRSASVMVVNQGTGEPLYAKNPQMPAPIASITKLMTAMVTLDARLPMGEEITISDADVDRVKGTGSRLPLGTRLTREELLHLALIASENRAASALSRAYPGGRDAFVAAMNRKARALGMEQTRFVDGTGLHSGNQSTAADLARLVDAAYRYPLIRNISTTPSYDVVVPGTQVVKVKEHGKLRTVHRPVQRQVAFVNTNSLVRAGEWDIGLSKTGYIREAGHCLVMQARIAEQRVIIVLLDAVGKWSRLDDATRIRRWLESDDLRRVVSRDHRNSV